MTCESQQYCLRWNNHRSNLLTVFDQLLENGSFTDVTIAVDCGQTVQCHKIVLAACSSYFQSLFHNLPDRNGAMVHPIVVLKDVRYSEIKAILQYMYRGEVNVAQEQLNDLLKIANMLKVKGLVQENAGGREEEHSAHDFRGEEIDPRPCEASPPPAISTSTNTGAIVHSSARVPSPPHSSTSSYEMNTVQNHIASLSMWGPPTSLPGYMQSSMHSSYLGSSYDNYETSPHKRARKLMQPLHMSHDKESILRKRLDVSHADSSQGMSPLLQLDSHESIHYRDNNGPTNGSNRRNSMDLSQKEINLSDEDEKHPSAISEPERLPTKLGIVNQPSVQPKPEWKRYKQYTRHDITSAIEAVRNGMSAVQAAREFGVPSRTLYDKVKKLGIQTLRPPKRTLPTNGQSSWCGIDSIRLMDNIVSSQPEIENENSNVNVAEGGNTSVATGAPLEATLPYSNATAEDMSQDRDSMSDTTTRSTQSPVIRRAKSNQQQQQQNMDDEVEDLSVSRKSDIPVIVQSSTTASDAVKSERDSEPDNNEYHYFV